MFQKGLKPPTSFVFEVLGYRMQMMKFCQLNERSKTINLIVHINICTSVYYFFIKSIQVISLIDSHQCDAFFEMFFANNDVHWKNEIVFLVEMNN